MNILEQDLISIDEAAKALNLDVKRLREVNFGMVRSHAQVDMFGNECSGLCGV